MKVQIQCKFEKCYPKKLKHFQLQFIELDMKQLAASCDGAEKIEEIVKPLLQKRTLEEIGLENVLKPTKPEEEKTKFFLEETVEDGPGLAEPQEEASESVKEQETTSELEKKHGTDFETAETQEMVSEPVKEHETTSELTKEQEPAFEPEKLHETPPEPMEPQNFGESEAKAAHNPEAHLELGETSENQEIREQEHKEVVITSTEPEFHEIDLNSAVLIPKIAVEPQLDPISEYLTELTQDDPIEEEEGWGWGDDDGEEQEISSKEVESPKEKCKKDD